MSIAAISGSPSANSRSAALLRHVLARFDDGTPRHEIVLRDLPAAALVRADVDDPAIRRARDQVAAARLVVVATPRLIRPCSQRRRGTDEERIDEDEAVTGKTSGSRCG